MVGLSTVKTHPSPRYSIDYHRTRNLERKNEVNSSTKTEEHCIQRFGLGNGTWETIEESSASRILLTKSLLQELDYQSIRDKQPLGHELIEALAQVAICLSLGAHHVARRNLR